MSSWPQDVYARHSSVTNWVTANASFHKYILAQLKARGALRSRDLEDRAQVSWRSSGWTHDRNVSQMLEFLSARGEVAISRREGNERFWDLAARVLPVHLPAVAAEVAKRTLAERHLRSLGIARPKVVGAVGAAAEVEGAPGPWVVDAELLERPFSGRTAILSPFDRLIYDRARALAVWLRLQARDLCSRGKEEVGLLRAAHCERRTIGCESRCESGPEERNAVGPRLAYRERRDCR